MAQKFQEEETPGRENLKYVWKYYLLTFAGIGLLWLSRKAEAPLSTVLAAAGAIGFLTGTLLTLYWDRKRKRRLEEEDSRR